MIIHGNALTVLKTLDAECVDCVITSPPYYGLRAYKTEPQVWPDNWRGELGLEPDIGMYIDHLLLVFTEIKRVLKKTGTLWVVIDDCYASPSGNMGKGMKYGGEPKVSKKQYESMPKKIKINLPAKSLCCIPDRFKVAMVYSGWLCINEIIWYKPSCMPESCTDRFTNNFEKIYFFTRIGKHYFEQQFESMSNNELKRLQRDHGGNNQRDYPGGDSHHLGNYYGKTPEDAMSTFEKGRNARAVWSINPLDTNKPKWFEHYATFPIEIVMKCLDAGCPPRGVVLDPFMGSGTVAQGAAETRREWIGIDLDPACERMTDDRVGLWK